MNWVLDRSEKFPTEGGCRTNKTEYLRGRERKWAKTPPEGKKKKGLAKRGRAISSPSKQKVQEEIAAADNRPRATLGDWRACEYLVYVSRRVQSLSSAPSCKGLFF